VRRHAKDTLDKLVKDSEVGEDDAHRAEGELDKLTSKYTGTIDEVVKSKEAELLEV
jgi:ribosome recycling factor